MSTPDRTWLTAGDVGIPIVVDFTDGRAPYSLEDATVVLTFYPPKSAASFTRTVTPLDAPNSHRVRYLSQAGDFTTPGLWRVGGVATWTDGRKVSVPCDALSMSFTVKPAM